MPKGITHVLLFTSFLLSLFLLLPVTIAENQERSINFSNVSVDCDEPTLLSSRLVPPAFVDHPYKTYLPLIANIPPFVIIGGEFHLYTEKGIGDNFRHKGLTFFANAAELDMGDIQFSHSYEPSIVRIFYSDGSCNQWSYPITKTKRIGLVFPDPDDKVAHPQSPIKIGVNHVTVEFEISLEHGSATATMPFTFFYIPDGDFPSVVAVNTMEDLGWELSYPFGEKGEYIGHETIHGTSFLRLGVDPLLGDAPQPNCNDAEISSAIASLSLQIPPHSDYKLYIDGVVRTQDQNPSNTATYDAFEIFINGHFIQRYSNQQPPIICNNPVWREVPINAQIPLNGYTGQIILSLENHLRYDDKFYTYTLIDMIWIDK